MSESTCKEESTAPASGSSSAPEAGDAVGGLPDAPLMLLNTGRQPARFLVLEFK